MIFDLSRFHGNHHLSKKPRGLQDFHQHLSDLSEATYVGKKKNSGGIHHDIHGEFLLESSIRYVFSLVVLSNGYYIWVCLKIVYP